jgi:acyl carrier protein
MGSMDITLDQVKHIVGEVLQLGDRVNEFSRETILLGSIPEFDSMAVVAVITALEDNFGVAMEDDEISAEIFETVGALQDFLNQKVSG